MRSHAKGPWTKTGPAPSDGALDFAILSQDQDIIAEFFGRSGERIFHDAEANADRMLSCVNACEGIEDPSVVPEMIEALRFYASNAGKTKWVQGRMIEIDPDAGPLYERYEIPACDGGELARSLLSRIDTKKGSAA